MKVSVEGLSSGYGSADVIRGVSLDVGAGEAYALVGRNGMGKSTFLKSIIGMVPHRRGSVVLGPHNTIGLRTHRIIRLGVGYCAQEQALFPGLSVAENLKSRVVAKERVNRERRNEVIERFPILSKRLNQRAGTLSGGEQKLLVLARALMASPSLLIVDEISAGLQPAMVHIVQDALNSERETRGTTLILVEQNLSLSMCIADRIGIMKSGEIIDQLDTNSPDAARSALLELAP